MTSKGKKKDRKCPECGEEAYERGTLLVGGSPGGPLRFEFDGGNVIKVRSNACRACGFIDSRIDTTEWVKKRIKSLMDVVGRTFHEDYRVWASGFEESDNSGIVSITLQHLSKESGMSRPRMEPLLRKHISDTKGKQTIYDRDQYQRVLDYPTPRKKKEFSTILSIDEKKKALRIKWKRTAKWSAKGKPPRNEDGSWASWV